MFQSVVNCQEVEYRCSSGREKTSSLHIHDFDISNFLLFFQIYAKSEGLEYGVNLEMHPKFLDFCLEQLFLRGFRAGEV